MTFTDELKTLTDDAHSAAEQASFVGKLLAGTESTEAYTRMIGQYLPLYDALECAVRQVHDEPPLSAFYDERLARTSAIRHDLTRLEGPTQHAELRSTTEYVERLGALAAQQDATRILAHHYLRYLGDLSGGQVIGRLVQRHYGVRDEALTMWDFTAIGKTKPYKDAYRAKLDTEISADQQVVFIDECLQGYRLARDLFENLATAPAH